jgi:hypothetical protein
MPVPPIENGTRWCTPGDNSASSATSARPGTTRPVTSWPHSAISRGDTHAPNFSVGGVAERMIRTSDLSTGVQDNRIRTDPPDSTGRARSLGIGCASARGVALICSVAECISVPSKPR